MKKSDFKCINKCNPNEHIVYKEKSEDVIRPSFDFLELAKKADFICCPFCGALYPTTIKRINEYFKIILIQKSLNSAIKLLFMSEYESAIREAIIILENKIQDISNLPNLNGHNLVSEAFKYECDKQSKVISYPKIKINGMNDISEINEHEGLKLMLMGFFKGARNIYMHKNVSTKICMTLNILNQVSYFIAVIEGESLL